MGLWSFITTGEWTPPPKIVRIDGPYNLNYAHTATVHYADGSAQELLGDRYAILWFTAAGGEVPHEIKSILYKRRMFCEVTKEAGL